LFDFLAKKWGGWREEACPWPFFNGLLVSYIFMMKIMNEMKGKCKNYYLCQYVGRFESLIRKKRRKENVPKTKTNLFCV